MSCKTTLLDYLCIITSFVILGCRELREINVKNLQQITMVMYLRYIIYHNLHNSHQYYRSQRGDAYYTCELISMSIFLATKSG